MPETCRAHIDLVLINPNFIKFIKEKFPHKYHRYINGIGGADGEFSKYIIDHKNQFNEFANKYNESIILYALEFKFYRHSYTGSKYSRINFQQDVDKLKLLTNFKISNETQYCMNSKAIAFVSGKMSSGLIKTLLEVESKNEKTCRVILRK